MHAISPFDARVRVSASEIVLRRFISCRNPHHVNWLGRAEPGMAIRRFGLNRTEFAMRLNHRLQRQRRMSR